MTTPTLIRIPKVESMTGLGRHTIYRKVKDGTFPKPVMLGERASVWLETEVEEWLQSKIAQRGNHNA